jgi:hypothetical protein
MSSSKRKRKLRLPNKITISTAFLAPIDKLVKDLFIGIYHDYHKRFKLKVKNKKIHVAVCGIEEGTTKDHNQLGITISTDDRILIQVRDPSLEDSPENLTHCYVTVKFTEVLCHEMTHAMQTITGRKPKEFGKIRHKKNNTGESYFFDQYEVEARILESFYASTLGTQLMEASFDGSE